MAGQAIKLVRSNRQSDGGLAIIFYPSVATVSNRMFINTSKYINASKECQCFIGPRTQRGRCTVVSVVYAMNFHGGHSFALGLRI